MSTPQPSPEELAHQLALARAIAAQQGDQLAVMAIVEAIMEEDRDILSALAKS